MHDPNMFAVLEWAQRDVREKLVAAQLDNYPDSRIMTISEVFKEWMDWSKPVPYTQTKQEWEKDEYNKLFIEDEHGNIDRVESMRWYDKYHTDRQTSHRQQVLTSLALCLQHPCVVFYECGRREDGTYQWRGARFGVEGSEYASGFGCY